MKIFFFCAPPGPPENTCYEHQILALAEGFTELGIEHAANIDYWKYSLSEDKFSILRSGSVDDFRDYDVVVFSSAWYESGIINQLPKDLFRPSRKYKLIFLDSSDGLVTPGFRPEIRNCDLVLKSHYNHHYSYPLNFVPWQFGVTNRILQYCKPVVCAEREEHTLSNFRIGHPIRSLTEEILREYCYRIYPRDSCCDSTEDAVHLSRLDYLFWAQTGRRHYRQYYERLSRAILSNAAGGGADRFTPVLSLREHTLFARILRKLEKRLTFLPIRSVYQFDSWRFWESLSAGCCAIHVDLDKYGCVFPEQPISGVHYLGIDLDHPEASLSILGKQEQLHSISQNAREFVLKNYSPTAVARRLLNWIDLSSPFIHLNLHWTPRYF